MNIKVEIISYDHEGKGIAYLNHKIVFVPKTIIGEKVLISIVNEKKNYIEANLIKIIEPSNQRIEVKCPYYDKCGGCAFLHMNYNEELIIKKQIVHDILKKYANIDIPFNLIKSDKDYYYRNKIELKISNDLWGYYNNKSHDFIPIDNCLLAKESINKIIKSKNLFDIKNGTIIIKSNYNDEIIISINTDNSYKIDIPKLKQENKIIGVIVNDKIIYGENYFYEKVLNNIFKVNINSFFQINLDILEKIIKYLNNYDYQSVLDLYCGVGTLGIAINKDKLYGIEINDASIKDAIINSKINKQDNYYLLGDASNLTKIKDTINTIIIDPPRSGLNKITRELIINSNVNNIIYMSCNPITLARDLSFLKNNYNIKELTVYDMFPHTKHVETVCILTRKAL